MIYTLNEIQQICVFSFQINSDCKSLILRRNTSLFFLTSWWLEIMRMYVNDRPRILSHKGNKIASVGRSADFHTSSETLSDAGVMT